MKNYHPGVYKQKVSLALAFYLAAIELYDPKNRNFKFYIPSYYLMGHAMELLLKGVWEYENDAIWTQRSHRLTKVYSLIKDLKLSREDERLLEDYDKLNDGRGGLRYDNEPKKEFFPTLFDGEVELFQKVITHIQNRYID